MKKNPVLWITVIILILVVGFIVMEIFVPKKLVLGAQTGRVGRFVKPEEIIPAYYDAPIENKAMEIIDNEIEDIEA